MIIERLLGIHVRSDHYKPKIPSNCAIFNENTFLIDLELLQNILDRSHNHTLQYEELKSCNSNTVTFRCRSLRKYEYKYDQVREWPVKWPFSRTFTLFNVTMTPMDDMDWMSYIFLSKCTCSSITSIVNRPHFIWETVNDEYFTQSTQNIYYTYTKLSSNHNDPCCSHPKAFIYGGSWYYTPKIRRTGIIVTKVFIFNFGVILWKSVNDSRSFESITQTPMYFESYKAELISGFIIYTINVGICIAIC
jgi:hypothetical protein